MRGANVYLLLGETLTLVDTGMPGSEEAILDYIECLGRDAGDDTRRHRSNDTFFDRRDEVLRDRSTFNLIDEFKTFATLQRRHANMDIAVLPSATRLLLMAVDDFLHRFFDGFPVRDCNGI